MRDQIQQMPWQTRGAWLAGAAASLLLAGIVEPVAAQDASTQPPMSAAQATTLPAIKVNASRLFIAPFDVPAALSVAASIFPRR